MNNLGGETGASRPGVVDSDDVVEASGDSAAECDVIMKGGITSGVVYPKSLVAIGSRYRFRGVGGASAGAIGAAVGAAAEFGRDEGGFDRLETLSADLGDGKLAALFQPQESTKPMLSLMLAATGNDRPGPPRKGLGRLVAVLRALATGFPWASLLGITPGVVLAVVGGISGGVSGWLLLVGGILLTLFGWILAIGLRLYRKLTVAVPENLFGICRGLGRTANDPGFTDWLADRIDSIAGVASEHAPLRFGHVWTGTTDVSHRAAEERRVDLRMVTTCLSEGRPYEMPWEARRFFYDPDTWRTLFPNEVVKALEDAPPPAPFERSTREDQLWRWEESVAARHEPPLRRLPDPEHLPIIVATRLSLSFPLLISAVPLWTIDRRDQRTRNAVEAYRAAVKAGTPPPTTGLQFTKEWFTDGGFCSNFPLHMFDAALASRPAFAINLGRFPAGREPAPDQRKNVELAKDNQALLATSAELPERGLGAVVAFASAAVNTARNWQDGSYLNHPGFRDRIVRVLQTKQEGGMNLYMDRPTIEGLAERGWVAGEAIVEQFTQPQYPRTDPTATGWDNHRWVRFRALLSALPNWLASWARGRAILGNEIDNPPSYPLEGRAKSLAISLAEGLDDLVRILAEANPKAIKDLEEEPNPLGAIRRIPKI